MILQAGITMEVLNIPAAFFWAAIFYSFITGALVGAISVIIRDIRRKRK